VIITKIDGDARRRCAVGRKRSEADPVWHRREAQRVEAFHPDRMADRSSHGRDVDAPRKAEKRSTPSRSSVEQIIARAPHLEDFGDAAVKKL
jgi:signal recognition particle GTPase